MALLHPPLPAPLPAPLLSGGSSASAASPGTATDSSPLRGAGAGCDATVLRAGGVVLRCAAAGPAATGDELEVLLVSRRRKPGSFTVPAGKFEEEADRSSFEVCALRETREEAGVECEILSDLGWFAGASKDGSLRRTRFFALLLLQESSAWEEADQRCRCWYPVLEAQRLVEHSDMLRELLEKVAGMLPELQREVHSRTSGQRRPNSPLHMHHLREQALNQQLRGNSLSSDDSEGTSRRRSKSRTSSVSKPSLSAAGGDDSELFVGLAEVEDSEGHRHGAQELAGASPEPPVAAAPCLATPPRQPAPSCPGAATRSVRAGSFEKVKVVEGLDGEFFCFYEHQVGGHFCLVKPAPESKHITVRPPKPVANGEGLVQISASGVVMKPLNEYEHSFYQSMLCEYPAFKVYTPQIFGTKMLTMHQVTALAADADEKAEESFLGERMRSHQCQHYIVMQDLASCMQRPRILDLKMGFRQRSKRHSARKRESARAKAMNSTSHAIGFRICGMHMEDRSHDKYWGRKLPLVALRGALASFFLHDRASHEEQRFQVTHLLERIRGLHDTAESMLGWRFWSTSLLFLHDGAVPSSMPDCRLIDFAHCTRVRSRTPDEEFLCGLRNLMVFLEALRDGLEHEPWIVGRLAPHPSGGAEQDAEELEDEAENSDRETDAMAAAFAGASEST